MTPAVLIEQELAAAEAEQHDGNDGKAREGCDGTPPTHSAGPILPSSYPSGG